MKRSILLLAAGLPFAAPVLSHDPGRGDDDRRQSWHEQRQEWRSDRGDRRGHWERRYGWNAYQPVPAWHSPPPPPRGYAWDPWRRGYVWVAPGYPAPGWGLFIPLR